MRSIRVARKADFQAICDMVSSAEELFYVYPRGVFPWTPKQLNYLARERKELSVMIQDEKVIAFANLYGLEPGGHACIGNLIVNRRVRGEGIGREMVRHMLRVLENKYALPEARISVFSRNVKALLLYSSLGFIPYGIEERPDVAGKRVALLHLVKKLGSGLERSTV